MKKNVSLIVISCFLALLLAGCGIGSDTKTKSVSATANPQSPATANADNPSKDLAKLFIGTWRSVEKSGGFYENMEFMKNGFATFDGGGDRIDLEYKFVDGYTNKIAMKANGLNIIADFAFQDGKLYMSRGTERAVYQKVTTK